MLVCMGAERVGENWRILASSIIETHMNLIPERIRRKHSKITENAIRLENINELTQC